MSEETWSEEFPTVPDEGIVLGNTNPDKVREFAHRLISAYVPSNTGDARFAEITIDYGGKGTTCGFLPSWLHWRLGCRKKEYVNRTDEKYGLSYKTGQNMSFVFNGGKAPFKLYAVGVLPERYDTVFISDGLWGKDHNTNTEHVCLFIRQEYENGKYYWVTADSGQKNDDGKECARIVRRIVSGDILGGRKIIGTRSLLDYPFTAQASLYVAGSLWLRCYFMRVYSTHESV